jgi:Glycosyltransferase family 87
VQAPPESSTTSPRDPGSLAATLGSTLFIAAASVAGMLLAFADKLPCRSGAWNSYTGQFQDFCYTDIYPLYFGEGLAKGNVPYLGHPVEYPVLTGWTMQVAGWLVHFADTYAAGQHFFDITVLILGVCGVAGVLATAHAAGPERRWTMLMVALSPALILGAFINWDLLAMALGMLGIAAWASRRGVLAGVLLGLAVAAKFYPLVIFAPLLLLSFRTGQLREFARTLGAAVAAWLAVNLPIALVAPSGWGYFYAFSKSRGADWGSIWFYFEHLNVPLLGSTQLGTLNFLSGAFLAVLLAGITVLALAAPRRPRLPQLCYLVLAAFLITNKVWSPQYVVWLVPLAVLARPRLWPYWLWQLGEVGYFFAIWGYLLFDWAQQGHVFTGYQGLSSGPYFTAVLIRLGTVALLAGWVVRDVLQPGRDVVRADGIDDPAGGIFDNAPDRFVLRKRRPAAASGVSQTTGELAARTTPSSSAGSIVPLVRSACRS